MLQYEMEGGEGLGIVPFGSMHEDQCSEGESGDDDAERYRAWGKMTLYACMAKMHNFMALTAQ